MIRFKNTLMIGITARRYIPDVLNNRMIAYLHSDEKFQRRGLDQKCGTGHPPSVRRPGPVIGYTAECAR